MSIGNHSYHGNAEKRHKTFISSPPALTGATTIISGPTTGNIDDAYTDDSSQSL
jgi:hypothetical protein